MTQKFIPIVLTAAILFACNVRTKDKLANDEAKQFEMLMNDTTTVQIIDSAYDFGKVTDGEKVEFKYRFKNTGTKPLLITNASASCGCTVPQKPDKPISPGDTGFIKVVFDSKGRVGSAHKTINVIANARPLFPTLSLTGEVLKKE